MPSRTCVYTVFYSLVLVFFFSPRLLHADDIWNAPAFSSSAEALRTAAAAIKADKDAEATLLLHYVRFSYDAQGRSTEVWHSIYRVENEEGVKDWAESSSTWEPWHESKPEIRARVISPDGTVHQLDQKTLNDVPAHENEPDLYTDDREYGGPLPAIAVGAIVEEEIIIRETTPFFSGGQVMRYSMMKSAPVNKTRFIISHPEGLPLHYV